MTTDQMDLNGIRVLVVDDSPTVLEYTKRVLEKYGAVVETANDIWITSTIYEFEPNIILMDVNLGTLSNGPVACKALKNKSFTEGIAIVLYSSQDADDLASISTDCGADGFITKSGDPSELVQSVMPYIHSHPIANASVGTI